MIKKAFLYLLLLLNFSNLLSQSDNLSQFDDKFLHFGFALSSNTAGFHIEKTFPGSDSMASVLVNPKSGFSLGVVTSVNINPNFKIRFVLPSLSFQERVIEYTYFNASNQKIEDSKVLNSTYLEFPVLLKFRTDRIHNFAVYSLAGFRYGIDMNSNIDVNNDGASLQDQVIKLSKTDFGAEVGGGVDLFLKYFKLGIELKLGVGMKNMLYLNQNNAASINETPTNFESAIESLKSRVWTFSFTFEG